MDQQNKRKDAEMKQLTSRVNILEGNANLVTGNIPFIWQISNFKQLVKESQRETILFYSPIFQCLSGYTAALDMEINKNGLIDVTLYRFNGALDGKLDFPMQFERFSFTLFIDGAQIKKVFSYNGKVGNTNKYTQNFFTREETRGLEYTGFYKTENLPASLTNESEVKLVFHIW